MISIRLPTILFSCTFLLLTLASHGFWIPPHRLTNKEHHTTCNQSRLSTNDHDAVLASRRDFFVSAFSLAGAFVVLLPKSPAFALENPPTKAELDRIKLGYKQIQNLLNNFEKETTVCRDNGGECKRDADPIRKALGLRSTTDPLFQIEKVFAKVKYMDIDPDKLDQFFDATEEWNSSINMSNSMAFISQFGEYNPGGGKDEVLKYLNESKKQVVIAEKALKTILDCIGAE
eukprot:CAMPEP_0172419114 /NCGR_PEP_ID=MMETSP1064-20121228/5556_1 /TAXON_ID=202472 /ORGANISM="Aulacoseira subarctica , Strain CCAP 1002/5" /LENGTH=230 /DNA_ID=CAMNT_0013158409 /DNA_START=39 /DNA_END=731 /DNA_ORIENTATION=-